MSNEINLIQSELIIAQQKNEILRLKQDLEKTQAIKTSRLEDSLFSPTLYQHYQKVAETLSRSSVIPVIYKGKPEDIFVAMAMGYQLGFPIEQSLQDIAVINGRPCLWGDGLLSLALNHPECLSIKEEPIIDNGITVGFCCTVIRKGHEPHTQTFTLKDAERAGLLSRGTVWKSYPSRMLQMRARSLALRDKFADALRGLRIAEIENDDKQLHEVIEGDFTNSGSQIQKLKKILNIKDENNEGIIKDSTDATYDITEASNGRIKDRANSSEIFNKQNTQEAKQNNGKRQMDAFGSEENTVHDKGEIDHPISKDQLEIIYKIIEEGNFDHENIEKALAYFKVKEFENLSDSQAKKLIKKLTKQ